ncbi:isocitrate lyase/PEP mutase family protein [Flavivirga algicola]|uniref:Isocitrate lyase/phosphoenolpyruvate mutase family protein n=1 Tax=Flavivirga algicola TaxID=2729136 RepID=A0ABX1RXB5_9FLAO|nr:isocitrate lyase/phosphoenolpyruvate mutase family protein [Flavivirga algicola]NMH87318.1 isocitrate lyase/phosphoenolpyruvate mutase family protein [Flavivirga algicola]
MEFKNLHHQDTPLLIANVWDVPSAKTAEKLNLQAIATSSSAIAMSLGYNDGEDMKFSELEYVVKQILSNTNLPLSVDLESGYSRYPIEIANHILRLEALGVVGINIEDSVVNEKRTLLNANEFAETLMGVNAILKKENSAIFINVRIDTFILLQENVIEATKKRIELYQNVGANGIFIPCIEKEKDIKNIVNCTHLPINVMCMPNLPDFDTLDKLGVKRISMGDFLFKKMYHEFEESTKAILDQKSFKSIFDFA